MVPTIVAIPPDSVTNSGAIRRGPRSGSYDRSGHRCVTEPAPLESPCRTGGAPSTDGHPFTSLPRDLFSSSPTRETLQLLAHPPTTPSIETHEEEMTLHVASHRPRTPVRLSALACLLTLVCSTTLACLVSTAPVAAQESTTLIRNGRLLDGSGNPWIYADVFVRGDRIEAIGSLASTRADEVIDADGLYVAPGFIDSPSHAGGGLASEGLSHAEPLLAMGLTTVFVNPDGGGPVDIPAQGDALLEHGLGVNVAQLVPQGSVRREVMGSADRAATPAELEHMRQIVVAGMEAGAWGLSSGTYYVPGSYTPPVEIQELAKEVAPYGGAYTSHIRDESTYSVGPIAAVEEVIDVGRAAGIPAVLTHVKALGPHVWGYGEAIVKRVERARDQGVQVFADQYPYTASATGLEAALLPRWSQAGGRDSLMARMDDPETMARIREGMVAGLDRRGGADRIQFRRYQPDPSIEGRLLRERTTAVPTAGRMALRRRAGKSGDMGR